MKKCKWVEKGKHRYIFDLTKIKSVAKGDRTRFICEICDYPITRWSTIKLNDL